MARCAEMRGEIVHHRASRCTEKAPEVVNVKARALIGWVETERGKRKEPEEVGCGERARAVHSAARSVTDSAALAKASRRWMHCGRDCVLRVLKQCRQAPDGENKREN